MLLCHGAIPRLLPAALLLVIRAVSHAAPAPLVTSVAVPGTDLDVNLSSHVGQPYDAAAVQRDVRYLWSLGRFDDVKVEAAETDGGIRLVYRVKQTPKPRLHEIRIEPNSFGLRLRVLQGAPIDFLRAHQIAMDAQRQLVIEGYRDARVDYRLTPAPHGEADLKLKVEPGNELRVTQLRFEGGDAPAGALRALRTHRILPGIPFLWKGWRLLPAYSAEAVDADVARVISGYLRNGYLDAEARPGPVAIEGKDATVTIHVNPGAYYSIPTDLCSKAFAARHAAQSQGVIDFAAKFDINRGLSFERGPAYRVGRISFSGNHRYRDAAMRANFLLVEGNVMDERLLRRSVARLNRASIFEPIDEKSVVVRSDAARRTADVTLRLTERRPGSWKLSGPVGPMSLAGPLQASISSRLPAWGRGIFELSTYTASISLFAFGKPLLPILNAPKGFIPVAAIQRPYSAGEGWKSGFAFAPQLGWKNSGAGYVATQLEQRLLPLLSGERNAEPDLSITVTRAAGEAVMICEPPKPRLTPLRTAAGVALQFLGAVPVM